MRYSFAKTSSLLDKYKIPQVRQYLAKDEGQARSYAKRIGFPVVMKIVSPSVIHKSDSGGVVVGVKSDEEVKRVFRKLKKKDMEGILIQEMVKGREVIIGSKKDPQFGYVIMFGLGGIFVEVLKDVAFRIVPLERKDAKEMIEEIKGYPILSGVRGEKPVNFAVLEDVILKVSRMVEKNGIDELDINPLFINEKQAIAADIRIFKHQPKN